MKNIFDKISYSDRIFFIQLLDFMDDLVIKCDYDAFIYETPEIIKERNKYIAVKNGQDSIYTWDINEEIFYPTNDGNTPGINGTIVKLSDDTYIVKDRIWDKDSDGINRKYVQFKKNKSEFITNLTDKEKDLISNFYRNKFLNNFVEKNRYYRMIMGEPDYELLMEDSKDRYINNKYNPKWTPKLPTIDFGVIGSPEYEKVYLHEIKDSGQFHKYAEIYSDFAKNNFAKFNAEIEKAKAKYTGDPEDLLYLDFLTYDKRDNQMLNDIEALSKSKSGDILGFKAKNLTNKDISTFFNAYKEMQSYLMIVPYLTHYKYSTELYDRMMTVMCLILGFMRFLVKRVDNYIYMDLSLKSELIAFFNDFNMSKLTEVLNIEELKSLIPIMDELISLKGCNKCLLNIIDTLGLKNITIYKYLIFKTIKSDINGDYIFDTSKSIDEIYDLKAVRIPIRDNDKHESISKLLNNKSEHILINELVATDEFFGGIYKNAESRAEYIEKVQKTLKSTKKFNYFYSKYIGILTISNVLKSIRDIIYIMDIIQNDEKTMNSTIKVKGIDSDISVKSIFVAINYLFDVLHERDIDTVLNDTSKYYIWKSPCNKNCNNYSGFNRDKIDYNNTYIHVFGNSPNTVIDSNTGEEFITPFIHKSMQKVAEELSIENDEYADSDDILDYFYDLTPCEESLGAKIWSYLTEKDRYYTREFEHRIQLSKSDEKYNEYIDSTPNTNLQKKIASLRARRGFNEHMLNITQFRKIFNSKLPKPYQEITEKISYFEYFSTIDNKLLKMLNTRIRDITNNIFTSEIVLNNEIVETISISFSMIIHELISELFGSIFQIFDNTHVKFKDSNNNIIIGDTVTEFLLKRNVNLRESISHAILGDLQIFHKLLVLINLFKHYTVQTTNAESRYEIQPPEAGKLEFFDTLYNIETKSSLVDFLISNDTAKYIANSEFLDYLKIRESIEIDTKIEFNPDILTFKNEVKECEHTSIPIDFLTHMDIAYHVSEIEKTEKLTFHDEAITINKFPFTSELPLKSLLKLVYPIHGYAHDIFNIADKASFKYGNFKMADELQFKDSLVEIRSGK